MGLPGFPKPSEPTRGRSRARQGWQSPRPNSVPGSVLWGPACLQKGGVRPQTTCPVDAGARGNAPSRQTDQIESQEQPSHAQANQAGGSFPSGSEGRGDPEKGRDGEGRGRLEGLRARGREEVCTGGRAGGKGPSAQRCPEQFCAPQTEGKAWTLPRSSACAFPGHHAVQEGGPGSPEGKGERWPHRLEIGRASCRERV